MPSLCTFWECSAKWLSITEIQIIHCVHQKLLVNVPQFSSNHCRCCSTIVMREDGRFLITMLLSVSVHLSVYLSVNWCNYLLYLPLNRYSYIFANKTHTWKVLGNLTKQIIQSWKLLKIIRNANIILLLLWFTKQI